MELVFLVVGFVWAAVGAGWDLASHRIPNKLSYSGIVAGIVLRTSILGWRGLESALLGLLVGGGVFFLFYILRSMGAGDVKLMAAVGCITGPARIPQILIACALAGGVMALVMMIYKKRAGKTMRNVGRLMLFRLTHGIKAHPTLNIDNPESLRLPYGVAIAAGALYPLVNAVLSR